MSRDLVLVNYPAIAHDDYWPYGQAGSTTSTRSQHFTKGGADVMAGTMDIYLDREPLGSDECSALVHNSSTGRLAFFGEDGRIEIMTVRYAVDAGTLVCYVPAGAFAGDRAVPVTLESFGEGKSGSWSVVLKGRGRHIVRETDVQMVELLLCRTAAPGEIPLRLMADTMSGTRNRVSWPLMQPLPAY